MVIVLTRYVAGHRVIRLKDQPTSFGCVQFAQHDPLEFLLALVRPIQHIHVAAERDGVTNLPSEIHDVQPSLGLQGIVGVHANLDEIGQDALHIPTPVIDDGEPVRVTHIDDRLHAGLEHPAPIRWRKEQVLPVGHVPPDDHAVQQSIRGSDLRLG